MRPREAELRSHYDQLQYYSPLDRHTFTEICAVVDVTPGSPVLDVGCGDGRLARRNPDLTVDGVDYNPFRADRASAECADLYDFLETTGRRWKLAAFVEVLEHLEDPATAVRLARSVADAVVATVCGCCVVAGPDGCAG